MKFTYLSFVALLLAAALNINAQKVIDVSIASEKEKYSADMAIDLTVTLTNVSKEPVRILSYYTPVNDIEDDLLSVSLGPEPVTYIGPHYKRAEPVDSDYLTLDPGESISGIVPLWNYYDISRSGYYSIRYNTAVLSEQPGDDPSDISDITSNTIFVYIEGREPSLDTRDEDDEDLKADASNEYKSCSDAQKNELITARQHALNYADDSYDYVTLQNGGTRYTTWFGTYNSIHGAILRGSFDKIRDAIAYERIKFLCNCNKSDYAYVNPLLKYRIHICRAFWTAPMTGTDSKAGTLIHEISHFLATAASIDKANGHTAAMNLANTHPLLAVKNANNLEYFAEATPYNPYNPCAPTVYFSTGAPLTAYWDGANCQVMPVPRGASPFIYRNGFYTKGFHGSSCPSPSSYDGANCYIMPYPSWRITYFIYAGNLYITPGPGHTCPPPSQFDSANCYIMPLPPGTSPFKYANNLYITPPPYCPLGYFDGANCYIGSPSPSRKAFIWANYFYYEH